MKIVIAICLLSVVAPTFAMKRTHTGDCSTVSMDLLSLLPSDLFKKIVYDYVMHIPVLQKDYTEIDVLDFVKDTRKFLSDYVNNRDNLASYVYVSHFWLDTIYQSTRALYELYQKILSEKSFSPCTLLSYVLNRDLCNNNRGIPENMYKSHQFVLKEKIKHAEQNNPEIKYIFLGGWTTIIEKGGIARTFACFLEYCTAEKKVNKEPRFFMYCLLSGKEEYVARYRDRDTQGNFTFKNFFSALKVQSSQKRIMYAVSLASFFICELCAKIRTMEQYCVEQHIQAQYPDTIFSPISKGTIAGEVFGGALTQRRTEIVRATIALPTTSFSLFDACITPYFSRTDVCKYV